MTASPPITVLDRNYVQILDRLGDQFNQLIPKSVKFCAAKLLKIFERLTTWKMQTYSLPLERCWFWIPIIKSRALISEDQSELFAQENKRSPPRSLYEELQGEHCKDVIREALKLLTGTFQLVGCRRNPFNGQDRTYQYQADLDRLKTLLEDTCQKSPLESDISPLKGGISSFNTQISLMITKIISMAFSNPFSTDNAVAAEFETESEPSEPPPPQDPESSPSPDQSFVKPEGMGEDLSPPPPATQFSAELIELKIEDNRTTRKEMERHRDRISDALTYVRQEVAKRWVLNSTGLFVKALRKGYKPQLHPPSPPPQLQSPRINFGEVDHACFMAMQMGDRAFVQGKLEALCRDGFAAEAEQICNAHSTWGFYVENGCIEVF